MDWWRNSLYESSTVLYNQSKKKVVKSTVYTSSPWMTISPNPHPSGLSDLGMPDSHSAPGKVHLMPFIGWSDFFMCHKPRELCCYQNRYRSSFAIGITPKYAWDDVIMALSGYLLPPWFSGTRPKVVEEHVLEVQPWLQTSQTNFKSRKLGLQCAAMPS